MPFTPSLDDDGILRVGGRLDKAHLNYSAKHPLILRSRIARLLIGKARHDCGYQEWKWEGLPATDLLDDWIEKSAEKSGEKLFRLQRWKADNGRPKMAHLSKFRSPGEKSSTLSSTKNCTCLDLSTLRIRDRSFICTTSACSHAWSPELSTYKHGLVVSAQESQQNRYITSCFSNVLKDFNFYIID